MDYDMSGDQGEAWAEPTHVILAVERAEALAEEGRTLQALTREHAALLALVAQVASAYNPQPGVFLAVEDDALDLALDELNGWVADHHPDWQG